MSVGTTGALPKVPASASFLGQGVAWPLAYEANTGRLRLSVGAQCVVDSLGSILSTAPGERPMQPDFGCDVGTFEPNDVARLGARVQDAVVNHEGRVDRIDIAPRESGRPEELAVDINYTLAGQATTQVLTYPFWIGP